MSAIWGCIEYEKSLCSIKSMASEYRRKCKLDQIREVEFKNSLIGSGIQEINEEDELETMPYIVDDGKNIITADCILDNREELIHELMPSAKDDIAQIPSGKLICLAYEKWHYDFVKHIEGMFAVAVYNADKQELFLCTDQVSSRSLYYYKEKDICLFSTLISPIRKICPDIKPNEMYLKDFALLPGLMPNISSTETPWEGIYIIEAGCSVIISEEGVTKNRYYRPKNRNLSKNIEELKTEFLRIYNKAVVRASRTKGSVGIALSGGLDSSSVAAFAAPELKKHGKDLISYTFVPHYDVSRFYDKRMIVNEAPYVAELSKMYPSIETNFTDNDGKSFWGSLDELIDILEIPFKAFVNLPILLDIYRSAAERGCKIVLNGQTGNASVSYGNIDDVVFDQYRNGHYIKAVKSYNNFCKKAGLSRKKWMPKIVKSILSQDSDDNKQPELLPEDINTFVNKELLESYKFSERNTSGVVLQKMKRLLRSEEHLSKLYFLPALSYIGAMETKLGLNAGLVIRDATRDVNVLDFCASFPFEYYCYDGIPRYLIRGFMEELLPRKILYPLIKSGVQSADWIYRLNDDKKCIYEEIKKLSTDESIKTFIDNAKLSGFLNENMPFVHSNERAYLDLFMILVLYKFIK